MTNRIDPDVIEAAAKAIHIVRFGKAFPWDSETGAAQAERIHCRTMAEAAIRAADEKRGMKREFVKPEVLSKLQNEPMVRDVSNWRPAGRDEQNIDRKEGR